MKVYTHPLSTFSRRVEIALLEKGLDVDRAVVDMAKREHRSDAYLALNPYGRVPTLVDGDLVLPESTAILEYLELTHPEPALVPADAKQRALVTMHIKLCDLELSLPGSPAVFGKRFLPKERWRVDEIERARKPLERHFAELNKRLEGKAFLVADRFTLAEVCYIPFLHFMHLLEVEIPDNVQRWWQTLSQRPSVQATVPAV